MKKRFVYFYFMKREPDQIQATVPEHIEYWKKRNLPGYMGGVFADRSGGLIIFEANDIEEATKLILSDPFVLKDLLEDKWIKEWLAE